MSYQGPRSDAVYPGSQRRAREAIANRRNFKAGSLRGVRHSDGSYTVYSYNEVILEMNDKGLITYKNRERRYSVPTAKHQAIVRGAIGEYELEHGGQGIGHAGKPRAAKVHHTRTDYHNMGRASGTEFGS